MSRERQIRDGLAAERIRALFDYDPLTGIFIRKVRMGRYQPGTVAGCKTEHGYLVIRVDGGLCYAHRLAWMYVHGKWPEQLIDHINGIRTDNRIANLRDVADAENVQNTSRARPSSRTGLLGVWAYEGKEFFGASITVNGKRHTKYGFETAQAAHQWYLEQKRVLHPGAAVTLMGGAP